MPFRFSLDAVLRLRQSLERQQELLLQAANYRVAAVQRDRDELDRYTQELASQVSAQLAAGLSAAELQFNTLCRAVLSGRCQQLDQALNQAYAERDACAQAFQKTRRDREMVETLRDRQFQLHRQLEARRDQRRLDDLFLLRRAHLLRG